MLCLVSMTQGGIPKRQFDPLRKELLIHYGYQHILTLTALQDAGCVVWCGVHCDCGVLQLWCIVIVVYCDCGVL